MIITEEPIDGLEPSSVLYESTVSPSTLYRLEPVLGTAPSCRRYKLRASLPMLHRRGALAANRTRAYPLPRDCTTTVLRRLATCTGFGPVISALTGQRDVHYANRPKVVSEGVEPPQPKRAVYSRLVSPMTSATPWAGIFVDAEYQPKTARSGMLDLHGHYRVPNSACCC